jgi:hypothetical protein
MAQDGARPLEDGWLTDTPVSDSVLRRFVHNQADLNELVACGAGGRAERARGVSLADSVGPVPFMNQALLTRPVLDLADGVLDTVDAFYDESDHPATLLSLWPTPDLRPRGWELVGHPMLVLRSPGPPPPEQSSTNRVVVAASADELATAERVAIEGYPFEGARDLAPGCLFPRDAVDGGLTVRVAYVDGGPAAMANRYIAHGVVNLCMAATLPSARRRGVWRALVGARIADAPELPAVAFTSDDSRPGFIAMGFLPVTRLTLWIR